jgi:MoaD family protein
VIVNIPFALRQYTLNESKLRVEACTVGELLRKLDSSFPGLSSFIVTEGGELRRYVNIFVNEDDVRLGEGLLTQLREGDRITIVPVVAGG